MIAYLSTAVLKRSACNPSNFDKMSISQILKLNISTVLFLKYVNFSTEKSMLEHSRISQ